MVGQFKEHICFALYTVAVLVSIAETVWKIKSLIDHPAYLDRPEFVLSLNIFGSIVTVVDIAFLILIYAKVTFMHFKNRILRFEYPFPIGLNFIYHMVIMAPIQVVLLLENNFLENTYAICYNFQLFVITTVVIHYAMRLFNVRKELQLIEFNDDAYYSKIDPQAEQCHSANSGVFKEFNDIFGRFNFYVIIHSCIIITVIVNIMLVMVFVGEINEGNNRLQFVFIILRVGTGTFMISTICIASHKTEMEWKNFESKLSRHCGSYALRAVLLERQFSACNYYFINNELLFTVGLGRLTNATMI